MSFKAERGTSKRMRKPLQWFRFYSEAIDDPKVQRLPPHLFKTWVNLLCLAGTNGGTLPNIDDIAFRLRMSAQDAEQHVSDLILAGLIDVTQSGRSPHNWNSRQFVSDTSTERVRKHRKLKAETQCNVSVTADETAPETETETETESEQKQTQPSCADETQPEQLAGWQDLKSALNGSTEAMIADVQRFMGPIAKRADAVNWLTGTVSAFGSSRTAQAWTLLTAKLARGELVPSPLPLWSRTAKGLKADDAPTAAGMPAFKSFRQQDAEGARALLERHRAKAAAKELAQ